MTRKELLAYKGDLDELHVVEYCCSQKQYHIQSLRSHITRTDTTFGHSKEGQWFPIAIAASYKHAHKICNFIVKNDLVQKNILDPQ